MKVSSCDSNGTPSHFSFYGTGALSSQPETLFLSGRKLKQRLWSLIAQSTSQISYSDQLRLWLSFGCRFSLLD